MIRYSPDHHLCLELPALGALGRILVGCVVFDHRLDEHKNFIGVLAGVGDQDRLRKIGQLRRIGVVGFRPVISPCRVICGRGDHRPFLAEFVAVGQGQPIQTTRRNGAFLRAWADVAGVWGARPALDDCVERDDEMENGFPFKINLSQARKGEIRRDVAVERMAASD